MMIKAKIMRMFLQRKQCKQFNILLSYMTNEIYIVQIEQIHAFVNILYDFYKAPISYIKPCVD